MNYGTFHEDNFVIQGHAPRIPHINIRTAYPNFSASWVPWQCVAKPERHVVNGRDREDACMTHDGPFVERDLEVAIAGKPALLICRVDFASDRESQIAWDICASMRVLTTATFGR